MSEDLLHCHCVIPSRSESNQQRASEQHEVDGHEPTRLDMSLFILSTCLRALAPAPQPSVVLAVTTKVTGARKAVFCLFVI